MPYQKTKDGSLVNEVTLGDGYPLSNDKQPLKVGGEASIINVSSPTPDGSVDGEVEVKGKLRAKDTVIQGDLKVFSDSDVSPQFRFQSKQGKNCQFILESAANTLTQLSLKNNQGSWHFYRKSSTTSLEITDGTNTPLILDGNNVEFTNLTDGSITIDSFVDEHNMSSNSATKIPTQQSVKAYVDSEITGLVDSAPGALDTLNELAAALGDDASFATTVTNSIATKLPLAGGDMTGHLQVTASDGNHPGNGSFVPSGSDWQDVLRLGSTGTNGLNFIVNDGGTMKATYWTARWGAQHEWSRNSDPSSPDSNGYQLIARLTGNDTNQYFQLFAGTSNAIPVHIQSEGSTDTYFNNSSNNVAIGSTSAGGYKLQVTGTANITSDLTVDTSTLKVDATNNRVGIGTTSPSHKFHIKDSAPRLLIEGTGASAEDAEISRISGLWDGNYVADIQFLAGDDTTNEDNGKIAFRTYSASGVTGTRMLIDETGNVGIGTTSPSDFFTDFNNLVVGTGSGHNGMTIYSQSGYKSSIAFADGTSGNEMFRGMIIYDHNGDKLHFTTNGDGYPENTNEITMDSSGNLGIGTTSPAETLEVVGDFAVRGSELIDNPTFTSDLSDWTLSSDTPPTYVSGNMQMNSDGATFSTARQSFTTVSGVTYVLSGNITVHGSSNKIEIGTSAGASDNLNYTTTGTGTFTQTFTATATTTHIEVQDGGSGGGNTYSEVSVRQIATIYTDKTNNRVGIGTTSPSEKLDVAGSINLTGDINLGENKKIIFDSADTFIRSNTANPEDMIISANDDIILAPDDDVIIEKGATAWATFQGDERRLGVNTTSPTTTLDVEGTVSYKSISLSSSSDAFDVSGATTVTANSASGNIILGGFANGVLGQIIHVIHRSPTNSLRFEHNEATATQPIYTSTSADKTLSGYGGMTLFCDGNNWFEIGN